MQIVNDLKESVVEKKENDNKSAGNVISNSPVIQLQRFSKRFDYYITITNFYYCQWL